jgi:hypothetical protein
MIKDKKALPTVGSWAIIHFMEQKFEFYFLMTAKVYKSMIYGIFLYPLFVACVETFNWGIFHFLSFETMKSMGLAFMVLSLLFFPLSYFAEPFFVKNCEDIDVLGKKLFIASMLSVGMSELITLFGIIIYVTSANLKFFYLFFIISFVHLIMIRPRHSQWQKRLDKIIKH